MASIDSTVSPTAAAFLRISCLARVGTVYANSPEAEFINLECILDAIERLATEYLVNIDLESKAGD